jgi:hypothetical protein
MYSLVATYVIGLLIGQLVGNRVSPRQEWTGLDLSEHGEIAYATGTPEEPGHEPQEPRSWSDEPPEPRSWSDEPPELESWGDEPPEPKSWNRPMDIKSVLGPRP